MSPSTSTASKWTTVSVVVGAAVSTLAVVGGMWWTAAGLAYTAQTVAQQLPALQTQQQINTKDIAVLKQAQQYDDARYAEILTQLRSISDKLDRKQDRSQP